MPIYEVLYQRTENVWFQIEADSPEEAEDYFLSDGTEIDSKVRNSVVLGVELVG